MRYNHVECGRFSTMNDHGLAKELDGMLNYTPLSDEGRKLLKAVSNRLDAIAGVPLTDNAPMPATGYCRMRGIDLTQIATGIQSELDAALKDWVEESFVWLGLNESDRMNYVYAVLRGINNRIGVTSLSKAQLYLEVTKLDYDGKWRAFVDIPHAEDQSTLIRHYISETQYYAFPVQFLRTTAEIVPTPYNLKLPAWGDEIFTGATVDFDKAQILFYFKKPRTKEEGVFVCRIDGFIVQENVWKRDHF